MRLLFLLGAYKPTRPSNQLTDLFWASNLSTCCVFRIFMLLLIKYVLRILRCRHCPSKCPVVQLSVRTLLFSGIKIIATGFSCPSHFYAYLLPHLWLPQFSSCCCCCCRCRSASARFSLFPF